MKLYKYERPDKFRIDTHKEGKIWMALPNSFNDPLDCNLELTNTESIIFDLERVKAAAKALYENYGESHFASVHLTDDILAAMKNWWNGNADDFMPAFLKLIEKRVQGYGVQCFSKVFDNPLMWAHYADSHRGFCIEYEYHPMNLAIKSGTKFGMGAVTYVSELPKFDLTEIIFSPQNTIPKLYETKSYHWSYEQEYRLIYFNCNPLPGCGGGCTLLPEGLQITSIISGEKTCPSIKEELRAVASHLGVKFEIMTRGRYDCYLERQVE